MSVDDGGKERERRRMKGVMGCKMRMEFLLS